MKRPGDKSPDPPGGRALERLREFEDARLPPAEREEKDAECAEEASHDKKKKKENGGKRDGG